MRRWSDLVDTIANEHGRTHEHPNTPAPQKHTPRKCFAISIRDVRL